MNSKDGGDNIELDNEKTQSKQPLLVGTRGLPGTPRSTHTLEPTKTTKITIGSLLFRWLVMDGSLGQYWINLIAHGTHSQATIPSVRATSEQGRFPKKHGDGGE